MKKLLCLMALLAINLHADDSCCKKNAKCLLHINETTMQDLVVDQTTLNVVNQINQTTRTDLAVDQETLEIVNHLVDCSCTCTVILPQDFMDDEGNLTQSYLITEPGSYCLGANIDFAPVDDYIMPAIRILSDNVRLDLRGFTLNQVPETAFDVAAIRIGTDDFSPDTPVFKNISIFNGSITNFNGTGIDAENFAQFFDVPVAFESITLSDLNILDCGTSPNFSYDASGINLASFGNAQAGQDPTSTLGFRNIIIENCSVNRCLGNSAITVKTVENLVVSNTQANDLSNPFTLFDTFAHQYRGRNIEMFNCQGNGVSQTDPEALNSQTGGCDIEVSSNVYLKDCQFNDAFGEASFIVNSNFSLNKNFVAENCQFNNYRGGEFAKIVAGVHGSSGLSAFTEGAGFKWINCQFNESTSITSDKLSITAGFLGTTMGDMVFENCQACNLQALTPASLDDRPRRVCAGFYIWAELADSPDAQFGDASDVTYINCIASDIQSDSTHVTAGFYFAGGLNSITGTQVINKNVVYENCIAERISCITPFGIVAGITSSDPDILFGTDLGIPTVRQNLFISNCRVSDVRNNLQDAPSAYSAGIVVQSVINPVIQNNSISDCDRGILFTGTNNITPNCFQVALSQEDALAVPPVFIPLDIELQVTVSPDPDGINPIPAFYTIFEGPHLSAPITAEGEVTDPLNACSTVANDLTGKIGIVIAQGECNSTTFILNAEAAGDVATLIIDAQGFGPDSYEGSPNQTKVAVAISLQDGLALLDSLDANPGSTITISVAPSPANTYTFDNNTQVNSVNVTTLQIDPDGRSFICPSDDLTALGWQSGDTIFFDCNGNETIPELECDTNYYAIVYIPGFSKNGLIQNNKIDNCSISCYQDDAPTTLSGWVNNTAFNCGTVPTQFTNYDIDFAGVRPVDAGTLSAYPVGGNKYYNLSLVP